MSLKWRSRNVVPRIKSTFRFVTTKNSTGATNSPIPTYSTISPSAFIARFESSMRGGIRAGLVAERYGAAIHRKWIRFRPAPEFRTGVSADIIVRFCSTVAEIL